MTAYLWRFVFLLFCFTMSYSFPNNTSMVFRLTHRSSPDSPFYNDKLSTEELMAEHHRLMDIRMYTMNNTPNAVSLPANLDFTLALDIGVEPFGIVGIPDTGSTIIWTQCRTCLECYEQDTPLFDPRKSKTYKLLDCYDRLCDIENNPFFYCNDSYTCYYSTSYAVGPISRGEVATDTFSMWGNLFQMCFPGIVFGCGINNKDPDNFRIPGVFGLGNRRTSLINQLNIKAFSICQSQNPKKGSFIGFQEDAELLGKNTPLRTSPSGRYHLTLQAISVMGIIVDVSSYWFSMPEGSDIQGFYLDTGAKYTYLCAQGFEALKKTVVDQVGTHNFPSMQWDLCYATNEQRYDDLPTLVFHFDGYSFKIPRINVWVNDDQGRYCLAIKKSLYSFSIFGMFQMRGNIIGFDLEKNQLWIYNQDPCLELGPY